MIPEGWHYVPHGSTEPVQTVAPMIGGPADGSFTDIGCVEELADHIEIKGEQHVHYYALEQRGYLPFGQSTGVQSVWVYVFVLSERKAAGRA